MTAPQRRPSRLVSTTHLLLPRLHDRAIVWLQSPVVLAHDTEPQPDLMVQRRRVEPYKEREADAGDVLLLIEAADSSLAYDRSTKLRLYAQAGIGEYWVVDCNAKIVEAYRDPGPDDVRRVAGRAPLALQAFPDVELSIAEGIGISSARARAWRQPSSSPPGPAA